MRFKVSLLLALFALGFANGQQSQRIWLTSVKGSERSVDFLIALGTAQTVASNEFKRIVLLFRRAPVFGLRSTQYGANIGRLLQRVRSRKGFRLPNPSPSGANDEGRYKESQIIALTSQQYYVDVNENRTFDFEVDSRAGLDLEERSLTVELPLLPALGNYVELGLDFLRDLDFFPPGEAPAGSIPDDHTFDVLFELTLRDETVISRNSVFLDSSQVLPHVPFGSAGEFTVTTELIVNNPTAFATEGELIFYGTGGQLREVTINGVTATRHPFSLGPLASQSLVLDASAPLSQGWAVGYGELPLQFSSVFTTYSSAGSVSPSGGQDFRGEAGVSAAGVSQRHVLHMSRDGAGFNTGFAIANVAGVAAHLNLSLTDTEGALVASQELNLESKTQMAAFFLEFFGLADSPFSGTLLIMSDTDVSVLSLKTLNQIQTSSLAGGTP